MNKENTFKLPIRNTYKVVSVILSKDESKFTTVILKHGTAECIHLDTFLRYNDDTDIYIIEDVRSNLLDIDQYLCWKSADTILRNWWIDNNIKIKHDNILFLEYDVLINMKIKEQMFSNGVRSTFGYYYLQQKENNESFLIDPNWHWNFEISKIPLKLKSSTATSQFSASFFSRKSLDYVARPGWNSFYKMDILSDIRTTTILNYGNITLNEWEDDLGYILIDHLPISN